MRLLLLLAPLLGALSCTGTEGDTATPWKTHLRQAAVHQEEGRLEEAGSEYRAALAALGAAPSPPLQRAGALEGLARVLILQGDLEGAEALYETTLATLMDTVGLESSPGGRLVSVLGTLADLNLSLDRPARARHYYERINDLTRQGWIDLGPTDMALAYTLAGLARLHRAQGDSAAADSLAGRAMGVNLLVQGYDLFIGERYDEAKGQLQRALALQERFLGRDHSDVAQTATLLGRIAEIDGRLDEAARLYGRAVTALEHSGGGAPGDLDAARRDLTRVRTSLEPPPSG